MVVIYTILLIIAIIAMILLSLSIIMIIVTAIIEKVFNVDYEWVDGLCFVMTLMGLLIILVLYVLLWCLRLGIYLIN